MTKSDLEYIQRLKLLDKNEHIYKFYSEYKNRVAGNFFTDKRIAKYWIDERYREKDKIEFAFYSDIAAIDTVYDAGDTYCPYMLVTKTNGQQIRVCADGRRTEVEAFFEDAIKEWRLRKKDAVVYRSDLIRILFF